MFKLLCMVSFAIVAVAAPPPNAGEWPAGHRPVLAGRIVKREIAASPASEPVPNHANENGPTSAVEGQDDLEKAETFGFGYHRYYSYPRYYYPSYYYGYYPRYNYGYYW